MFFVLIYFAHYMNLNVIKDLNFINKLKNFSISLSNTHPLTKEGKKTK